MHAVARVSDQQERDHRTTAVATDKFCVAGSGMAPARDRRCSAPGRAQKGNCTIAKFPPLQSSLVPACMGSQRRQAATIPPDGSRPEVLDRSRTEKADVRLRSTASAAAQRPYSVSDRQVMSGISHGRYVVYRLIVPTGNEASHDECKVRP
jgi:hypothetical protein